MTYTVKEIYLTIQGEGVQTGVPAVFLRFSGCNLWSGREVDRKEAICKFCDTDFIGINGVNGGKFNTADELASVVEKIGVKSAQKWVVCTGGEPLLQLDTALIHALHSKSFKIAVETNGTIKAPKGLDWICVSPKANTEIKQNFGNELKLVYPQSENEPRKYENMDFDFFCLQPRDDSYLGKGKISHEKAVMDFCLRNPKWRLSIQSHKYLGIA